MDNGNSSVSLGLFRNSNIIRLCSLYIIPDLHKFPWFLVNLRGYRVLKTPVLKLGSRSGWRCCNDDV